MRTLETDLNPAKKRKLFEFTNGISFDVRLAREEVRVQKTWVEALRRGQYLNGEDAQTATASFDEALKLIEADEFPWQIEDEDIHMNLERFLTEKHGELGKRVHLGRSRNDLVATTLRLYTHKCLKGVNHLILDLMRSIHKVSKETTSLILPGMTHLQFGQPIRLAHIFLSYLCALERDFKKVEFTKECCLEHLPLGSAAFSGTHLEIDLKFLSQELGFRNPTRNSYDSVSDRDFILDGLNCFASIGTHLSRFCEDIIYLSSTALGIAQLPYNWSTGSSIMPNKRNPDILELIRAKTSRINALLYEGLSISKSIPTSYSSDFHELKKTFIFCFDEVVSCLENLAPFFEELNFSKKKATAFLNQGHILATDVANNLTKQGMPFREAYKFVASLIEEAEVSGKQIHELREKNRSKKVNLDFLTTLSFSDSTDERNQSGGTSITSIMDQIHFWEGRLGGNTAT